MIQSIDENKIINIRVKKLIENLEKDPLNKNIDSDNSILWESSENEIDNLISAIFSYGLLGELDKCNLLSKMIIKKPEFEKCIIYSYYLYISKSFAHRMLKSYGTAIKYNEKAFEIANLINDNDLLIRTLMNLCQLHYLSGDLKIAYYYSDEAFKLTDSVNNPYYIANAFNTFGVILYTNKEYERAISSYKHADFYYRKVDDYKSFINYCFLTINLGEVLFDLGHFDEATTYFDIGIEVSKRYNFEKYLVHSLNTLSIYMAHKKNYEQAYYYLSKYNLTLSKKDEINEIEITQEESDMVKELSTISNIREHNVRLNKHLLDLSTKIDKSNNKVAVQENLFNRLNTAIIENKITTYYQPKWCLLKNKIIGAEALVRWPQDDGSMVSPCEFIGLVEDMEIIKDLSLLVIKQSFAFCREIIDKYNTDFVMNINISPYQMINQNVARVLKREMFFAGIDPKNVEVEITERTFINSDPRALKQIELITSMGIKLALDDFGVGYSSLSYVNELPFNTIKIDKTLVDDVPKSQKACKILKGIVHMMNDLDISVLAEGVETLDQVNFLKQVGCKTIQGYYYGRPSSKEIFLKSLLYEINSF